MNKPADLDPHFDYLFRSLEKLEREMEDLRHAIHRVANQVNTLALAATVAKKRRAGGSKGAGEAPEPTA